MPCPTGYPARSPSVGHTGRATNLPAIRYVRAVTQVWTENTLLSATAAVRSLSGIGFQNGNRSISNGQAVGWRHLSGNLVPFRHGKPELQRGQNRHQRQAVQADGGRHNQRRCPHHRVYHWHLSVGQKA